MIAPVVIGGVGGSGTRVAAVVPPPSIGRIQTHDLRPFDRADLQYVESLGFAVP